jgi:hypothetical protein
MTIKTTTDPMGTTTAAPAPGHGCCAGGAATEPQNKIAKPAAVGQVKPPKATETCCRGAAGTN